MGTFSDYVVPACLPSSSSNSYTGQSATVSGWGTTSEGGDTSAFLKETSVNVVSATDSTCSGYGIDDTCRCVLMLLELTAAKETVEDLLYLMMVARILLLVLFHMVWVVLEMELLESMPRLLDILTGSPPTLLMVGVMVLRPQQQQQQHLLLEQLVTSLVILQSLEPTISMATKQLVFLVFVLQLMA